MKVSLKELGIDESAINQILLTHPELEKSLNANGLVDLGDPVGGDVIGQPSLETDLRVAITSPENELQGLRFLAQKTVGNLAHHYRVENEIDSQEPAMGYLPETDRQNFSNFIVFPQTRLLKFIQNARQTPISAIMQNNINMQGTNNPHTHNVNRGALAAARTAEWGTWNGWGHVVDSMPLSISQQILEFDIQFLPIGGVRPVYNAHGRCLTELDSGNNTYRLTLLEDVIAEVAYRNNAKPDALVYPGNFLTPDFQKIIAQFYRITNNRDAVLPNVTVQPAQYPVPQNGYSIDLMHPNKLGGPLRFFAAPRLEEVRISPPSASRPNAPTVTYSKPAAYSDSDFGSSDAGDYTYQVHAIGPRSEIGPADAGSGPMTIAAGQGISISISQPSGSDPKVSGYIIARTEKDSQATYWMEMIRKANNGPSSFVDLNHVRPNTADLLLLSTRPIPGEPGGFVRQLFLNMGSGRMGDAQNQQSTGMRLINLPLSRTLAAEQHLICGFHTADVYVPYHHVLIRNVKAA